MKKTGRSILRPVFFVLFVSLLLPVPGQAGAEERLEQLARSPYWLTLGHYRSTLGGWESRVDDPRFFLAPEGKTDPRAELEATLTAMQSDDPTGNDHVLCRYPARSAWLKEQLTELVAALPQVNCTDYDEMLAKVNPQSTELIYPGPHINSPASMFGHTLLTINGGYDSKLLDYAVNYAAHTAETNGFVYAFRGIFGFYEGRYSILPYATKVREYSDMERRDIWEYRLNLTPEETRRLIDHVWELQDVYADYYFFNENCSYNLLYLLDVARPGLSLAESTRHWVIPVDTIRLIEDAGLVERAHYRPSKAWRIRHLISGLPRREQQIARQISFAPETAEEAVAPLPPDQQRKVLDLAVEHLDYRFLKEGMEQAQYRRDFVTILKARSKRGKAPEGELDTSREVRPERSHRAARVTLGGGDQNGKPFAEISYRPGYHNLHDPAAGYPQGAQIEYLHTRFRLAEGEDPELERIEVINILSLAPRGVFFPSVSWKVTTGLQRHVAKDGERPLCGELIAGGGVAYGGERFLWYGFLDTRLLTGEETTLDPGIETGIHLQPLQRLSFGISARLACEVVEEAGEAWSVRGEGAFATSPNTALRWSVSRTDHWYGPAINEGLLEGAFYW